MLDELLDRIKGHDSQIQQIAKNAIGGDRSAAIAGFAGLFTSAAAGLPGVGSFVSMGVSLACFEPANAILDQQIQAWKAEEKNNELVGLVVQAVETLTHEALVALVRSQATSSEVLHSAISDSLIQSFRGQNFWGERLERKLDRVESLLKIPTERGGALGATQSEWAPPLSAKHENDTAQFYLEERSDEIDLRQIRPVPEHEHDSEKRSRSVRITRVKFVRMSPGMLFFYNHSKTSGLCNEVRLLSDQPSTFRCVDNVVGKNELKLTAYELAVDVTSMPLRIARECAWEMVSWNKFQGQEIDHWWVSVLNEAECRGQIVLRVCFPHEAGVGISDVIPKQRTSARAGTNGSVSWRAFGGKGRLVEVAPSTVEWTISAPVTGEEYGLFWTKDVMAPLRGIAARA